MKFINIERHKLLFSLYLIFTTFLVAPQIYAVKTLTLEQCISLALKNNENLKASSSNIKIYAQELKMSYSEFFPKFKSKVHYTLFDRAPSFIIKKNAFFPGFPPSDVELPSGERDIYAFTFSIEQPLFTGGYLTGSYEKAKIQKKASEVSSEKIKSEIILKVKSAYYDILKAYKRREIQKQSLRLKEEYKRVMEEEYKEGVSKKEELFLLYADISKQKLELFKTENEINVKEKTLKNLIGIDYDMDISLADELENKKLVIGLSESKDIALKNRKDLAEVYYMIKSAEKDIAVAESNFYPKASIIGSYTRQKETPLANPDLWTLMLTLKWDIFEWGRTKADVKRAKAKHERLSREYNSFKRDVMLDVEERWFKVKEAEQRVDVAKDSLIHAEEYYKNALLKYRENLLKTAELLEAETYLIQNKNEYISSIYDLNKALAEFEFSISSDITPLIAKGEVYEPYIEVVKIGETLKELPTETNMESDEEYYIQVGAFKYAKNAQKLLKRLKAYYPDVYIITTDNFNKVRIPGIKTKEQGKLILREIKEKFNIKAILRKDG